MRHYRRRAYLLLEMLSMLPAIALIMTVTSALAARVIHIQSVGMSYGQDAQTMRALAEQLAHDAASAERTRQYESDGQVTLELQSATGTVAYRSAGSTIVREPGGADAGPAQQRTLNRATVRLELETLASGRQLVWLVCAVRTPLAAGEVRGHAGVNRAERTQVVSTAALVGRGGPL